LLRCNFFLLAQIIERSESIAMKRFNTGLTIASAKTFVVIK